MVWNVNLTRTCPIIYFTLKKRELKLQNFRGFLAFYLLAKECMCKILQIIYFPEIFLCLGYEMSLPIVC